MTPQQKLLIEAALARGYQVEDMQESWHTEGIRIKKGDQQKIILKGAVYESMNKVMEIITGNKHASKNFLDECNIPTPKSVFFSRDLKEDQKKALQQQFKDQPNQSWVCKPVFGIHGDGILMNVHSLEQISKHLSLIPDNYTKWLLEEFVPGTDIRIQTIAGKLVAACRREPAYVIGDGRSSIQQLADVRHEVIQKQNIVNHLVIDHVSEQLLEQQGLVKTDIPEKDQKVILKEVANMSQGAYAVDITDELHEGYFKMVEEICQALSMEIIAIDAISQDHKKDPYKHAKVLEVNARPHWLQHTFSERKQHDIPGLIIESLFASKQN